MGARTPTAARPLLRLTYVSRTAGALEADVLATIREVSARHNGRCGLTGLLLHRGRGRRFFAALEGPERALLQRMEIIITDPRHRELRILSELRVEARRFENWSFASLPAGGPGPAPGRAEEAFITMLAGGLPGESRS